MTNLHTLNRRLDRLDSARPIADRRVIRMVREEGETQADAIARWCSQNPSEPPPDESTDFIILRSIVSPNAKSAWRGRWRGHERRAVRSLPTHICLSTLTRQPAPLVR